MNQYDHKKIEPKWQKKWEKEKLHKADDKSKKKKYYCLVEFPYPSGEGLHAGHVRSYTAMDIIARKRRAEGYNVLYPIGWDAFGLPTENYAIKTKTPPKAVTKKNTDTFRRQLKSLGLSFDWSREINTTDPAYYKWTQWIFLQLFKHGLAYKKKTSINWCLSCKIGLANEEVIDGECERCGGPTEKREKDQWMLAITKYADRLHDDLDGVDYLEKIKIQQRNWIGKSEGAVIKFQIPDSGFQIEVFTTRPDTLFGATYMVLAPDHELVVALKNQIKNWDEIVRYAAQTGKKTEIERTVEGKEKTGVKLEGVFAVNPANREKIPVFIADYVLKEYGTGAIMAVPAHDQRDFEFAKKFGVPMKTVIEPVTGEERPNEEKRKSIVALIKNPKNGKILSLNWGEKLGGRLFIGGGLEEKESPEAAAIREIKEETGYTDIRLVAVSEKIHHHYFAHAKGVARNIEAVGLYFELTGDNRVPVSHEQSEKGNFKIEWVSEEEAGRSVTDQLHAYVFQKFILNRAYAGTGVMVNSGKLSGFSSEEAKKKITEFVGGKFKTTYKLRDWVFSRQRYWGEPIPLIYCEKDGWVPVPEKDLPVRLPEIKAYTPTDTGESPLSKAKAWVNVKCPKCKGKAVRETDTMPNWAGSSWYYLRYIDPKNKKVLADRKKLDYFMPVDWYNGGMEHTTLHVLYSRFWHKFLFDIGAVPGKEPYAKRTSHGMILAEGGEKMSKSKGNVVNPDNIVKTFGADTLRLYEMFIGPFDQAVAWSGESIIGPRRFLERVWKMKEKIGKTGDGESARQVEKAVKKISDDIEAMRFNTAVSELMIVSNALDKSPSVSRQVYEKFLRILAPFAPHFADEIWAILGNKKSIHGEPWPKHDAAAFTEVTLTIMVQVNGKVRGKFTVPAETPEEKIKEMALSLPDTAKWVSGGEPKRVIYVKGRLVSIVV